MTITALHILFFVFYITLTSYAIYVWKTGKGRTRFGNLLDEDAVFFAGIILNVLTLVVVFAFLLVWLNEIIVISV